MNHCLRALLLIAATCWGGAWSVSRANDSSAELGVGGLTFTKNAEISIESEQLTITLDAVTVRYTFLNHSTKPVTLTVAFPLPDIDLADAANIAFPAADPLKDPDGFASAIDKMPPVVFQSCVYTVGVVAQIFSEASYPPLALDWNVTGKIRMEFDPAANTVDWQADTLDVRENPSGIRNGADDLVQNPRAVKNSLVNYLKGKSDFALKRFARPSTWGLDRTFRYKRELVFTID